MIIAEVPHLQLPPFAKQAFDVCGQVILSTSNFQALRHPNRTALRRSATALFERTQNLNLEDDRYYTIIAEGACLRQQLEQFSTELRRYRRDFHHPHIHFNLQQETIEQVLRRYAPLAKSGRKIELLEEGALQKQYSSHSGDFLSIIMVHSRHARPKVTRISLLEMFYLINFCGDSHVSRIADMLSLEAQHYFHEDSTQEITLEILPPEGEDPMALLGKILEGVEQTERRLKGKFKKR